VLSEDDSHKLRAISVDLSTGDHRFARRMSRLDPGARIGERWAHRGYNTVVVLAALEAVLCLALSASGTALSGLAALSLAVLTELLRRRRFASPREIDRTHIP